MAFGQGPNDPTGNWGGRQGDQYFNTTTSSLFVCTSDGGAADATWAGVSGGAGGWALLATATASASAQIDLSFSGTYRAWVVVFSDVVPATGDVEMRARFLVGATPKTGANDYHWSVEDIGGNAVTNVDTDNTGLGEDHMRIAGKDFGANSALGADPGDSANGTLWFYNPNQATRRCTMNGRTNWVDDEAVQDSHTSIVAGHLRANLEAIDGVRFYMESGNIAEGEFAMYGLAAS